MAKTQRVRIPMTRNAVRHPATSPISVPSGTPSTDPRGTAEKITAVARPTDSAGTSRLASPAPMDQKTTDGDPDQYT